MVSELGNDEIEDCETGRQFYQGILCVGGLVALSIG
jgi:hypothetical protein